MRRIAVARRVWSPCGELSTEKIIERNVAFPATGGFLPRGKTEQVSPQECTSLRCCFRAATPREKYRMQRHTGTERRETRSHGEYRKLIMCGTGRAMAPRCVGFWAHRHPCQQWLLNATRIGIRGTLRVFRNHQHRAPTVMQTHRCCCSYICRTIANPTKQGQSICR